MIQPNEIRLGNWVNTPREDQSPFRIDLIEHQSKTYCKVGMNVHFFENPVDKTQIVPFHPLTWENEDLTPIPLTEEVLLKCGFEVRTIMDYERGYTYIYHHPKIGLVSSDFVYCINDTNEYFEHDYIVDLGEPMTALHQLQNLFFALTGKELEYRADK